MRTPLSVRKFPYGQEGALSPGARACGTAWRRRLGGGCARAHLFLHDPDGHVGGSRGEGSEEDEERAHDGGDGHQAHELDQSVEHGQRALLAGSLLSVQFCPPGRDRILQLDARNLIRDQRQHALRQGARGISKRDPRYVMTGQRRAGGIVERVTCTAGLIAAEAAPVACLYAASISEERRCVGCLDAQGLPGVESPTVRWKPCVAGPVAEIADDRLASRSSVKVCPCDRELCRSARRLQKYR
jgi:hypothetical protein